MSFEIVELEDYDLPLLSELIELQREAFGELGLNEGTLPLMIRYGRVFLLKRDNEVIGSAELMKEWADSGCVFLVGFSIKKGQRKKGSGKVFLEEILNRLRSRTSRVRLTTSPQNQVALNLYRQFGFRQIGFWKDAYGKGEDRLLLELQFAE